MSYRSNKTGVKVDELLDKIDDLQDATHTKSGTMSAPDKIKLDNDCPDGELSFREIEDILNRWN